MAGTKRTPGPWEVNKYGLHVEVQQVDPDGVSIAIMTDGSEADARLMAAPAMAEAIRGMREWLDTTGVAEDCMKRTDILRAALALAEGGVD